MAQSKKKLWTPPTLRRFETPEELQSYCGNEFSSTEQKQITELIERMRSSKEELMAD